MSKNRSINPNIASSRIDVLERDEMFVFGSNLAGHHMGGAARAANMKFVAEWGSLRWPDWSVLCHTDHARRC